MGRIFLEHIGGFRLFSCAACHTALTNTNELITTRFDGLYGPAFLFNKVVNVIYRKDVGDVNVSSRHLVREVYCKKCKAPLGWISEFLEEKSQRYKEGRTLLERAFIEESDGLDDCVKSD